ncbi:MAG: hypothetical protein JW800_08155 [Candidatus Omnitrophica bacterium]|nr:hypothetical protein [Candidatus Omnitrophota bacterium]
MIKVKNGFTISELVVSTAITSLVICSAVSMSNSVMRNMARANRELLSSERGILVTQMFSNDVRSAKTIMTSYGSFHTGDQTVILAVPSIDAYGEPIDPELYNDRVIYILMDGNIMRIIDAYDSVSARADTTDVVVRSVTALSFSHNGTDLGSIADLSSVDSITMQATTSTILFGNSEYDDIIAAVSLRNK